MSTLGALVHALQVYAEIVEQVDDIGRLDYSTVSKLSYLDMAIMEALRMYSVAPALSRVAAQVTHFETVFSQLYPGRSVHILPYTF